MIGAPARSWTLDLVEHAEAARCAAMIAGDGAELRAMFSSIATWVHSSGQVDGPEAFIGKIESGASRYLTIDREAEAPRVLGDHVAIASGVVAMTALAGGETRLLRNRYINVWILVDGKPALVSAQSTKLG